MRKPWVTTEGYQGECRRSNGASKLVWTLMVSACGLVVTGGLLWMTNLSGRTSVAEAMLAVRGERLSKMEQAVQTIDTRLTRIEDKLDKVLVVGKR